MRLTQVNDIRTTDVELINKFKQLEQSYNGLKNSTNIIFATVSEMQNEQQADKSKSPESLNRDITTETDRGATGAIKSYVRYAKSNCKIYKPVARYFHLFVYRFLQM